MRFDDAYKIGDFTPHGAVYADQWEDAAREFREVEAALGRARLNEPYGTNERERFDLFHPSGPAKGLVVFVHGGYWLRFNRSYWSHYSAGATANRWCVAMPSYPLAPEARISEILTSVCRGIEAAAARVAGPIVLAGHSAGGHLVAMAVAEGSPLPLKVRVRIERVMPISPVSDLRPLLKTSMGAELRLDRDEADKMSPVLHTGPADVEVAVWVGAEERPVFIDQSLWLTQAWPGSKLHIAPGRHHFDILDPLADVGSAMTRTLIG